MADIKNANTGGTAKGEGKRRGGGGEAGDAEGGEQEGEEAANTPSMTLHGPPGLSEFYTATRHFMHRSDFPVAFEAVEVCCTYSGFIQQCTRFSATYVCAVCINSFVFCCMDRNHHHCCRRCCCWRRVLDPTRLLQSSQQCALHSTAVWGGRAPVCTIPRRLERLSISISISSKCFDLIRSYPIPLSGLGIP